MLARFVGAYTISSLSSLPNPVDLRRQLLGFSGRLALHRLYSGILYRITDTRRTVNGIAVAQRTGESTKALNERNRTAQGDCVTARGVMMEVTRGQ